MARATGKPSARSENPAGEDRERDLELYRRMVLVRLFEEKVHRVFLRGEVYGSTHLAIGQEAVSIGVTSVVREGDRLACTYRGHGHVLGLGTDPEAFMAELVGRASGICGGRAGSMNVIDVERGLIGCFGIVGGSLAAATGAGITLKRRGFGVAVALFGDGTANQAYFHECLNFAKVFDLPVVYICENNQYGEYTPMEQVTPGGIVARPAAMQIPSWEVDGQDLWEVRAAAAKALEHARTGGGPIFIEASTYRYSDHGRGDPVQYRPDGEMERWKHRDPIKIAKERLTSEHGFGESDIEAAEDEVRAEIERITEAALASPFPEPDPRASEFAVTERS